MTNLIVANAIYATQRWLFLPFFIQQQMSKSLMLCLEQVKSGRKGKKRKWKGSKKKKKGCLIKGKSGEKGKKEKKRIGEAHKKKMISLNWRKKYIENLRNISGSH